MHAAGIESLDPTRSIHVDDFDWYFSIYPHIQPESGQRGSIGVTYKWKPVLCQWVWCMRCFLTHHYTEAPLPDGTSTSTLYPLYIPWTCSESLAMAISEGTLDKKCAPINVEESCTAEMVFNVHTGDVNANERNTVIFFAIYNCLINYVALRRIAW